MLLWKLRMKLLLFYWEIKQFVKDRYSLTKYWGVEKKCCFPPSIDVHKELTFLTVLFRVSYFPEYFTWDFSTGAVTQSMQTTNSPTYPLVEENLFELNWVTTVREEKCLPFQMEEKSENPQSA